MERAAILSAPAYDIRAILDSDLSEPFAASRCVQKLWDAIDDGPRSAEYAHFRPDSALLEPEITVRDLGMFDTTMGNGWSVSPEYLGLTTFPARAGYDFASKPALVISASTF
jgi:hypothetical protein